SELFAPDGANEQDHAPTLDEDILFQSLLYHDVPEQLAERLVRTGRKGERTYGAWPRPAGNF
ncbi:MAG: hypothetical protein VCE74_16690, partial [Alphaproteobacteria bacterium]